MPSLSGVGTSANQEAAQEILTLQRAAPPATRHMGHVSQARVALLLRVSAEWSLRSGAGGAVSASQASSAAVALA